MKNITSSHNETHKHLQKLVTSSRYRRQSGQTVLEGVHLCQSYLQQVGRPLMCVFTDRAREQVEAAAIIENCESRGVRCVLMGEGNFRAISSVDNGIGVMFVVEVPAHKPPEQLVSSALLLDGVQDPGNMGTVLRTAAAAGVRDVFVSSGSASAWSPKVLRAGMGAHFALKVHEQSDLAALISTAGVPVLATSLEATESIYTKDLSGPAAWLFGSEGGGVSEALLSLGVERVIIPQNPDVESLNVAASVAICLFEQLRQHQVD